MLNYWDVELLLAKALQSEMKIKPQIHYLLMFLMKGLDSRT